jgi:ABC-type polysaccharide/polyol phosphate export permease
MLETLRELYRSADLLYMLTWREIKVRYKQSVMGVLWALLMPLVIVSAGSVVRYAFATYSGSPLSAGDLMSVAVKSAPYAFFVGSIRFGTSSLIANANLLTKIYMERAIFPVAAVLSQLFDFVVASLVLALALSVAGVGISSQLLWVPLLLLGLLALVLGLAMVLSAASLFFRDVKYLVEVVLTFAVFFTPVFYDAGMLGRWAPLILLNPVAPILESLATTIVHHQAPDLGWVAYSLLLSLLLFFLSVSLFRKLEPYFAENV